MSSNLNEQQWKSGKPTHTGWYIVSLNGKTAFGLFSSVMNSVKQKPWFIDGNYVEVDGWMELPKPINPKIPFKEGDYFMDVITKLVTRVNNQDFADHMNKSRDVYIRVKVTEEDYAP